VSVRPGLQVHGRLVCGQDDPLRGVSNREDEAITRVLEPQAQTITSRTDLAAALRALADRVDELDPARVVGELEALRMSIVFTSITPSAQPPVEDRLLKIADAADRLGVTRDWLRRRTDELPFVVKLSEGVVRYSSKGMDRWIARRTR
jgi:predicted DNA-binding transcriptional regulator AlpA